MRWMEKNILDGEAWRKMGRVMSFLDIDRGSVHRDRIVKQSDRLGQNHREGVKKGGQVNRRILVQQIGLLPSSSEVGGALGVM